MSTIEKRITRRGIPRDEFLAYFVTLGEETAPGHFTGPDWEVVVEKTRPFKLFGQAMVQMDLVFRGEEETVESMLSAFRLKFARA
jgi:hypothetical protein